MADVKITAAGELDLTDGFQLVSGGEAVIQQLRIRLNSFRGEWYLDREEGVPYYEHILGHKPRRETIEAIFRQAILTTPGVVNILEFEYDYDRTTRILSIDFVCKMDSGLVIKSEDYGPFIISVF